MEKFLSVEQAVARLQSAVEALMLAQNQLTNHDWEHTVDVWDLAALLQTVDEDAWAIADAIESWS
jgi:HD superfamily phosphodiesterase